MNRSLLLLLAIPAASYVWACSSSSSDNNTNNNGGDGGPGVDGSTPGTDGGGPLPGTDGGNPGTDGGNPGTDGGGPIGTNPIQGIAAAVEVVMDVGGTGGYLEGPKYFNNTLYVSDPIINGGAGVTYTVDIATNVATPFRDPSNGTFGMTADTKKALLIAAESNATTGDVVHVFSDGGTALIANAWDGGTGPLVPFDSPNDVTTRKSDGAIYMTDPGYQNNIASGSNHVFLITVAGAIKSVDSCMDGCRPNGIAISPDEKTLYVGYSYSGQATAPIIKKFPVNADGTLGTPTKFADGGVNVDGFAIDTSGNLYTAFTGGVNVYAPDGTKFGTITIPNNAEVGALAFGGAGGTTLFMAAGTAGGAHQNLFSVIVKVPGRIE